MPRPLWGSPTSPYSHWALAIRLHGLHRRITTLGWLRCDLCVCGPPHENGSFYPHYLGCRCRTGCTAVLSARLEATRSPCRHCLRSRLSVRLPFHPTPSQTVGHPRESVDGISPSVGWADGTGEPDAGTIFTDILRLPTG